VVGSVAEPGIEIAPAEPPPTRGPSPRFGSRPRAFLAQRRPRSTAAVRPAEAHRRAEPALAVLQRSRIVLQRGWVQDAWYGVRDARGNLRMFGPVQPQRLETTQLVRACLVGAVIHSSWQWGSDETSSAPAIDALWETLQETRRLGHPAAIGRSAHRWFAPPAYAILLVGTTVLTRHSKGYSPCACATSWQGSACHG
jgi:hypothetical protein